jgi:catechol 2,3-dioxygenase-like lactoylglutathione lyase family enzyme
MRWAALVPELVVTDLASTLPVYSDLFGFEVLFERHRFAYLALGEAQLMLLEGPGDPTWRTGSLERPFGRGINLQIEVDAVLPLRKRLEAAGYPVKVEVEENWYRQDDILHGHREFLVMDPDGYLLRFVESLGEKPIENSRTTTGLA